MKLQSLCLLLAIILGVAVCQIAEHEVKDSIDFGGYEETWYSGYLTIDDHHKIHYWYFPVQHGVSNAPLLVNINSGPGCSTLSREATYGSGPFVFVPGTSTMQKNDYSWNLNANVLYIDAPGVGYSMGPDDTEYSDSNVVDILYNAIHNFVEHYTSVQHSDVYIAGTGYAGLLVPRLSLLILNTNESSIVKEIPLTLKGMLIGNGITVDSQIPAKTVDFPYYKFMFLKDMGIITWDQIDDFLAACGYDPEDLKEKSDKCKEATKKINLIIEGLNQQDIDADCYFNPDGDSYTCYDEEHEGDFFNKDSIKTHLNVKDEFGEGTFKVCNKLNYKTSSSILYAYEELVKKNIKIWVFHGDLDAEVSTVSTMHWINQLRNDQGLADLVGYQSWFYQDILEASEDSRVQNGGSFWKMDGLTYVRFKGCGQDAMRCNQIGAQLMFKKYILGEDMPVNPFGDLN